MNHIVTKIAEGGRVVIPASIRKNLNLEVGDELILQVRGSEIVLVGRAQALRAARQLLRGKVQHGRSLVDELLAERRSEAQ